MRIILRDLKRDLEQKEQKLEKVTKKLTKIRKEQAADYGTGDYRRSCRSEF